MDAVRVIGHLGHPELSVGPPGDGDGRRRERFGSDQLDVELVFHFDRRKGVLWRLGRVGVKRRYRRGCVDFDLRRGEQRRDLLGLQSAGEDRGLVNAAFEVGEVVVTAAKGDFAGASGIRHLRFAAQLRRCGAVEVGADFGPVADEDDVVPGTDLNRGLTGQQGVFQVAVVKEQLSARGERAADADVIALGVRIAPEAEREQVTGRASLGSPFQNQKETE